MDDTALKEHLKRTADRLPIDVEARLEAVLGGAPTSSRDLGAQWRRALTAGVAALIAAGAILAAWELLPRGNDGTFAAGADPTGEIAYFSLSEGSSRFSARSFMIGDTSSRALTEGEAALPMWSPDGTMLAYAVVLDDGRVELRIQGAGETRTLLPAAHAFAWSPDGTRIAAAVGGTEWNGITIMGIDGSVLVDRTFPGDWDSVSWSPDGARLAMTGIPRDGGGSVPEDDGVFVGALEGGTLERLTTDPATSELSEHWASWSPDGNRIVFVGGTSYDDVDPHSDIYIAETDGSGVRALTDYPGLDGFPVWSPNGRWIMFASDRDASASQRSANADGDLGGVGIYVMTADGEGVRPILSATDREVSFPSAWRL